MTSSCGHLLVHLNVTVANSEDPDIGAVMEFSGKNKLNYGRVFPLIQLRFEDFLLIRGVSNNISLIYS